MLTTGLVAWCSGNTFHLMNEVIVHRAGLVLDGRLPVCR